MPCYDGGSRERAIDRIKAQCSDRYYDGGIIKGELSDRELEAIERQQAADARSAELNEALICITQAADSLKAAARWECNHLAIANLASANGHLRCAHQYAPVDTDGLTMEHLRAAQALVETTLESLEASR